MNITLWECFYFEEEPIEGGTASVQYHLQSPNHLTGVPSNPQPRLIKSEDGRNAAIPMAIGDKEIRYTFSDANGPDIENFTTSDYWVVQTQVDLIPTSPQDILAAMHDVWAASGLSAEFEAKPLSVKSVAYWIDTVDFDDKYVPARWVTQRETAVVVNQDVETMAASIIRLGRAHRECAAISVQAIRRA